MNFNLALICTDGRLVDTRAFHGSCSSSPSGRSPHPPQTLEPWESPLAFAGPEIPAWSQHTQSCLERPKMPRKGARVWEMHRVYIHTRYSLKDPRNLGRGRDPGASGAGHQSKDTGVDMDTNVAEIQRQAQML